MVSAFATPIVNYRFEDCASLNDELARIVLEQESSDPGVRRSNVGGWHSGTEFLAGGANAIQLLRRQIGQLVVELNASVFTSAADRRFTVDGWANVLRHGGYNTPHNHPNAFWSGVYYVNSNEPVEGRPFSGKLELMDPRPGASVTYAEDTRIYGRFLLNPVAGQVIVFPSWLQHLVHPYFGSTERISIAFNIVLET